MCNESNRTGGGKAHERGPQGTLERHTASHNHGGPRNTESERTGPAIRAPARKAHGETAKIPGGPRSRETQKHNGPAANPSYTSKRSQDTNTQPRGARTTEARQAGAARGATQAGHARPHTSTPTHMRGPSKKRPNRRGLLVHYHARLLLVSVHNCGCPICSSYTQHVTHVSYLAKTPMKCQSRPIMALIGMIQREVFLW